MEHIEFREINCGDLITETLKVKNDGYRLVQICCTRTQDGYELLYSFGLGYDILHFRINIDTDTKVLSISKIFPPAFLYENEIHDLFGVEIDLISIAYKGTLYRTEKKTPFK